MHALYLCIQPHCGSVGRLWRFLQNRTCTPADPPGPGRSPASSSHTRYIPERSTSPPDIGLQGRLQLVIEWEHITYLILVVRWVQLGAFSTHRTSCLWAPSPAGRTETPACSPEIWDRPRSCRKTRGSWTAAAWPAFASAGWSVAPASAAASSDWPPLLSRSSTGAEGCLLGERTEFKSLKN